MGSTLETAIVFTVVFMVIILMIVLPMNLCADSVNIANSANEEISFHLQNGDITEGRTINGIECHSTTPEELCTFLTGISENYRIIYGTIIEVSDEVD